MRGPCSTRGSCAREEKILFIFCQTTTFLSQKLAEGGRSFNGKSFKQTYVKYLSPPSISNSSILPVTMNQDPTCRAANLAKGVRYGIRKSIVK
jgi:hypothetical protein